MKAHMPIVVLSVLVIGCTAKPNLETERAAILQADSAWLAAAHSRNIDSTLGFWTEDARILSPGEPPIMGGTAIRKMLTDGFAIPEFTVAWHTSDVFVDEGGTMAYSVGTNAFTMPNQAGGIDTLRGQGVVVWRKSSDGRWRAALDAWTPQAAPR